ncbi:MAG: GLPGLI family protein [Bacteroidota bacterium]
MKTLLFTSLLLISLNALGQTQGNVTYEETIQFKINFDGNDALSKDLQSMLPSSKSTKKSLIFTEQHSLYKTDDSDTGDEKLANQSGDRNIQIVMKRPENVIYQNLSENKVIEKKEFMDRIFLISDDTEKKAWKITGEQKEILGYLCQKATTVRDSSDITAWFTSQIPVSSGPNSYGGLPGLILEINKDDGKAIITATEIDLETDISKAIIPPSKGKKVNRKQFTKIQKEKLEEMKLQYGGSGDGTRVFIQQN